MTFFSIDLRSFLGVTASVAVLIGIGWLTTKEDDIKAMKTGSMEKTAQKRKKLNIQFPYPAPEGWKWYMNENAIFGMLIPLDGWELEEEQAGFILSAPTPNSQIPTIFSATVFPRHPDDAAMKFMEEFNNKISNQPGVKVARDWEKRSMGKGAFVSYNMTYEDSDPNTGISGIIHNQLMVNPQTGTFYYVMFESPTEQYEDMWMQWGKKMFNSILLSPGV